METSLIYTLASLRNLPAASICVVYAQRLKNRFISPEFGREREKKLIEIGLETIVNFSPDEE